MILLSIDPGLEKTGFAVFDKDRKYPESFKFIFSGLIKTEKTTLKEYRLSVLYDALAKIIKKYRPKIMVIEELFFFKNKKTVIGVSQAQGVILLTASQFGVKVASLTPLKIKQVVTGYGLSDKKAIKKIVNMTVKITDKKISDDEYDAIAAGLAYCFENRVSAKINL